MRYFGGETGLIPVLNFDASGFAYEINNLHPRFGSNWGQKGASRKMRVMRDIGDNLCQA